MVQSLECFCVDRLCSPEPGDLILIYKTDAVTQPILKAPSSDEPVGTKKILCQSDQMLTGSKMQFNICKCRITTGEDHSILAFYKDDTSGYF